MHPRDGRGLLFGWLGSYFQNCHHFLLFLTIGCDVLIRTLSPLSNLAKSESG
jgi:hypothetical protein